MNGSCMKFQNSCVWWQNRIWTFSIGYSQMTFCMNPPVISAFLLKIWGTTARNLSIGDSYVIHSDGRSTCTMRAGEILRRFCIPSDHWWHVCIIWRVENINRTFKFWRRKKLWDHIENWYSSWSNWRRSAELPMILFVRVHLIHMIGWRSWSKKKGRFFPNGYSEMRIFDRSSPSSARTR